jgi:hypothetical protein
MDDDFTHRELVREYGRSTRESEAKEKMGESIF